MIEQTEERAGSTAYRLGAYARAASTLLGRIEGEDVGRDGLRETPSRFAKAFAFYTSGYAVNPAELLKTFEEDGYDQLVIVRDIPFYSLCEHHLAPFFGTVTIGYVPTGRVVGLSKLARLVDAYARRLQVQERFTRQVARELAEAHPLAPAGAAVTVRARHLCMESRGVQRPGATTVTSETLGVFREDARLRSEFLSLSEVER